MASNERLSDDGWRYWRESGFRVAGHAEGKVSLRLGGEAGSLFRLKAGDMMVLPAGVGHRRIGSDDGLKMIGAYRRGHSRYDMKRKGRVMQKVRLPDTDPFFGVEGPLRDPLGVSIIARQVAFTGSN